MRIQTSHRIESVRFLNCQLIESNGKLGQGIFGLLRLSKVFHHVSNDLLLSQGSSSLRIKNHLYNEAGEKSVCCTLSTVESALQLGVLVLNALEVVLACDPRRIT